MNRTPPSLLINAEEDKDLRAVLVGLPRGGLAARTLKPTA